MNINNIDISVYNATLIDRKFTNHDVVTVSDWLDGSPNPIYMRSFGRYKDINLTFLINIEELPFYLADNVCFESIDAIIEQLKFCTIEFDDILRYFACNFEGKAEPKKLKDGVFTLDVKLNCYKTYASEVKRYNTTEVTQLIINNTGSVESEVYLVITPSVNIPIFTITGLSKKPITLNNLVANIPHIIDGYLFRYLKAGASDITNYNAFEFPVLPKGDFVGNTTVGFSQAVNVGYQYYPKFN